LDGARARFSTTYSTASDEDFSALRAALLQHFEILGARENQRHLLLFRAAVNQLNHYAIVVPVRCAETLRAAFSGRYVFSANTRLKKFLITLAPGIKTSLR
jgi:hypothetical protein